MVGESHFSVVFKERRQYNQRGYARRVMRTGDMPSKASMARMEKEREIAKKKDAERKDAERKDAERRAKQEKERIRKEKEVCAMRGAHLLPTNLSLSLFVHQVA